MPSEKPKKTIGEIDKEIEALQQKQKQEEETDKALLKTLISLVGEDDPRVKELRINLGIEKTPAEKEAPKPKESKDDRLEKMNEALERVEAKRKEKISTGAERGDKILSKVSKGIEWWDSLGKNEKGFKGFGKRFGKMAVNLGLIGLISSVSVEAAAKAGIGTATALSGGLTSYLGTKMSIGLGMGTLMELGTSAKAKKIIKYSLMGAIGVASIASGAWLAAGVSAGISFGAGYAASKFTRESFQKKIDERSKKIKERKEDFLSGKEKSLEKIEEEIENLLKQNEKSRLIGKAAELLFGVATSVAILEVSGLAQDFHQEKIEEGHKQELEKSEMETQDKKIEEEKTDFQKDKVTTDVEEKPNVNPDAIVGKGEGIEHTLIRQIKNDPELAKELGYTGDPSDSKSLNEFAGVKAHVLAIKAGYVDMEGNEVRVAEADKVAYVLGIDNGQPTVTEMSSTGETLETNQEGREFERETDKHEYFHKKPEDIPVTTEDEKIENSGVILNDQQRDELLDTSTEAQAENPFERKLVEVTTDKEFTPETWAEAPENVYNISMEQFLAVNDSFNHTKETLMELAGDDLPNFTDTLERGRADAFLGIEEKGVAKLYQPLWKEVNKLHEITELEPLEPTLIYPPETPENYLYRAMHKAVLMDRLDEVKEGIALENTESLYDTEIGIAYNERYPSLYGGEVHFNYNDEGYPTEYKVSGTLIGLSPAKLPLLQGYAETIGDYCKENNFPYRGSEVPYVDMTARSLYVTSAAFEEIRDNPAYHEESELLKNSIERQIKEINRYGEVVDVRKLPEEISNYP
ncbi:MAG TPA: hypothetical protein VFQ59_01875 [Candidatus Paceibacterota bacterium]|nr:hypothetical protein [Candidatus Paceibacterota bacterium]